MYHPESNDKIKIVLLGNDESGKTKLLSRFADDDFQYDDNYKYTIGVDFKIKRLIYKNTTIQLQIWDTAGQERYRPLARAYICGSALSIIILSAVEPKQNKIAQIRYWQRLIDDSTQGASKPKIAIIETKCDLPGAIPLSDDDLKEFAESYVFYQTFSAKTAIGISELYKNIDLLMPQLIDTSDNKNKSYTLPASEAHSPILLSPTSEQLNLENISEHQAKMILHSLKEILIHGPLNETNKSYDFSIFGGGKPVMAKNGVAYTVPAHVNRWIDSMLLVENNVSGSNYHRDFLSQLFEFIKNGAEHKRFSRSSTTQDFYENCLPSLIQHCVTPTSENEQHNYFTIRGKIDQFDENAAYTLLQQIKSKLEIGPSYINKTTSYQIGLFGGKKCTTQYGKTIKVPDHVASILDYINRDIRPTTYQEKLLTVYHYLVIARHSKCSSRNESTQSFYKSLPIFVADEINKINTQLKLPTL